MAWYILYRKDNGRKVSETSILPDVVAVDYDVLTLPDRPAGQMWDEAQRAFVARPADTLIDRFQEIISRDNDFADAWNSLSAANKNKLRNALSRWAGKFRYRHSNELFNLGDPE